MSGDDIIYRFKKALDDLLANDRKLLDLNVNERTISHKLAEHMQRHYEGWNVDCEYNKLGAGGRKWICISQDVFLRARANGDIPKCIASVAELQEIADKVSVFPDIIVHQRGDRHKNLLVVEVKKAGSPRSLQEWDQYKLSHFVKILGYEIGLLVIVRTGKKLSTEKPPYVLLSYDKGTSEFTDVT